MQGIQVKFILQPRVKTLGSDLVLPCLPSWLTAELNEGWGTALGDDF